jgi:hypothetical protein
MTTPPPRPYTEAHLKLLYENLPKDSSSYLAGLIKDSQFNNRDLFNAIKKQSHSRKFNTHTKNKIRSIRCILWDVPTSELPMWVSEIEPDIKAVIKWRLSIVG